MKPTQEQVIAWAREAGLITESKRTTLDVMQDSYTQLEIAFTLAYEAGRKDETCTEGLEGIEFIGHRSLQLIYVTRTAADKARAAIRARMNQQ